MCLLEENFTPSTHRQIRMCSSNLKLDFIPDLVMKGEGQVFSPKNCVL